MCLLFPFAVRRCEPTYICWDANEQFHWASPNNMLDLLEEHEDRDGDKNTSQRSKEARSKIAKWNYKHEDKRGQTAAADEEQQQQQQQHQRTPPQAQAAHHGAGSSSTYPAGAGAHGHSSRYSQDDDKREAVRLLADNDRGRARSATWQHAEGRH